MTSRRSGYGSRWGYQVDLTASRRNGQRCELGIFGKEDMSFGRLGRSDRERLLDTASRSALTKGRWDSRGGEIAEMSGQGC